MTKEAFHKTWQFRLLQVLYFGTLIPISLFLIIGGLFYSDVEIAGFVWATVLAFGYWLMKRLFYYVMFGEIVLQK